jgi:hypothetical protein
MPTEGASIAEQIERLARAMIREMQDLSDEVVNRRLSIQPTNTLFQLGTHVAGSTRYWTITNTGGTDFHRNRPAEFSASGSLAEVIADLESMINQMNSHLPSLDAAALDAPVTLAGASFSGMAPGTVLRQRHAALHALEHFGLHLGHVQITRQILGYAPPSDEE